MDKIITVPFIRRIFISANKNAAPQLAQKRRDCRESKPNRNRFPAKSQALKSISQNERIDVMIDQVHAHQFTEKTNIAK